MALTAKKVYAILKRQISDMEAKLNSPVRYRGTVATADLLPLNPAIGDMYNIESKSIYGEAGMNVAWNGVVWDTMGAPIDMSLYLTKEEAETVIQRLVTEYFEKNPVKPGATTEQAQQIEQNKTDIASLKEETNSLKEDIVNNDKYAQNEIGYPFGNGGRLVDGYLSEEAVMMPATSKGEKTTDFVYLSDNSTGISTKIKSSSEENELWMRIIWYNSEKEKISSVNPTSDLTVLKTYNKPDNAKYVRVSWRAYGDSVQMLSIILNPMSISGRLTEVEQNKAETKNVLSLSLDMLGIAEVENCIFDSNVYRKNLIVFKAKAGRVYTFKVKFGNALKTICYLYALYPDETSMFPSFSFSISAGKTEGSISVTAQKSETIRFCITTTESDVSVQNASIETQTDFNNKIERIENQLSIYPIFHHSTNVSVEESNIIQSRNTIYQSRNIEIKTDGSDFSGIQFKLYGVHSGDIISAKANRDIGNNGTVRIDCYDYENKRIGAENWKSKVTVVDGTHFAEVTFPACWGTALDKDTVVTFSDILIKFANVDCLEEYVYGDGNSVYTGEKITLNNDNKTKHKCNINLWRDFLSSNTPSITDYKLNNNQSATQYGKYIFIFQQGGPDAVIDFESKEIISTFDITPSNNMHKNSAQFTDIFYDSSDEFPLLLISRCGNADSMYLTNYDECLVYRVLRDGVSFTFTLVNSIRTDAETHGNSWAADNVNGKLYMVGFKNGTWAVTENNPIGYWVWEMPTRLDIISGKEISLSELDCVAKMEHPFAVGQGCFANGGMLYSGFDTSVWAIDVMRGRITSKVPLPAAWEPEGLWLYDGKIYVTQKRGNDTTGENPMRIYEIDFN